MAQLVVQAVAVQVFSLVVVEPQHRPEQVQLLFTETQVEMDLLQPHNA
jgi:hypothetical protein